VRASPSALAMSSNLVIRTPPTKAREGQPSTGKSGHFAFKVLSLHGCADSGELLALLMQPAGRAGRGCPRAPELDDHASHLSSLRPSPESAFLSRGCRPKGGSCSQRPADPRALQPLHTLLGWAAQQEEAGGPSLHSQTRSHTPVRQIN